MVFLSAGKAYAVFKSKNDADVAISKINSGLVVGGRYVFMLEPWSNFLCVQSQHVLSCNDFFLQSGVLYDLFHY